MFKFLIIFLCSLNLQASDDQAWKVAIQSSKLKLKVSSYKTLTPVERQISCEHLSFRYEQLKSVLDDLKWIIGLNADRSSVESAFQYLENRLLADPRPIAHDFHYEIETFIPLEELMVSEKMPNSIAFLGSPHFELHVPETSELSFSKLEKTETGLKVAVKVNAYDVCAREKIDVLVLDQCPINQEPDLLCSEGSLCPSPITIDWQQCKSVKAYKLYLTGFQKVLGSRKKEIRRVSI